MINDALLEEKPSTKPQKPSFEFGHQKIAKLATLGYEFIGNLPSCYSDVPGSQRLASYLFYRNGTYYQYKGNPFFNEVDTLAFDHNNEALPNSAFLKITNQHFIYVVVKENEGSAEPKYVLFLKKTQKKRLMNL